MTSDFEAMKAKKERARKAMFAQVREAGYVQLVANYNGGNDEGGAEEVSCYRADESIEEVGWEHPMAVLVNDLLSEHYGTWAGDFTAYGTITVDAVAETVTMIGEESTMMQVEMEL